MATTPHDRYATGLAQSARRLGVKATKRHATLDMRDLDASWPTYLEAQSIVVQQEYEVSMRQALLYFIEVMLAAGHTIPGEPLRRPWDQDHITALLRLTGPIYLKKLIGAGWSEQAALIKSLRRTALWVIGDMYAEAQQQVIDTGEWANERSTYTVMQGYERKIEPTACAFCRMLAGGARKHAVYRLSKVWIKPHPGCKCEAVPLPVYRTERVLTAREIALNRQMYEHIKAQKDRALAVARAA